MRTGRAPQTLWLIPPAGSKVLDREMCSHATVLDYDAVMES